MNSYCRICTQSGAGFPNLCALTSSVSNRRPSRWAKLLPLLITSLLAACANHSEPTVSICDTATPTEDCPEDQAEFSVGQQLSAHLIADEPFAARTIIGKILRLSNTDTIPLGNRMITPEPNQQSIVQTLPFHEFGAQAEGRFLVQFVDENNQLIAEKAFAIR